MHVYPVTGTLSDHLAKMATLPNSTNADLSNHLLKMPVLAKLINTDLSKGFTVLYVAESMPGLSRWLGPLRWREKAILIDSRRLTGNYGSDSAMMSSSSPIGSPLIFRNSGSLTFLHSFFRKYSWRFLSFSKVMLRHFTEPSSTANSSSNVGFGDALYISIFTVLDLRIDEIVALLLYYCLSSLY